MKVATLLDSEDGRAALDTFSAPEGLSPDAALKLVEAVRSQAGRLRRRGLFDQFDQILLAAEES